MPMPIDFGRTHPKKSGTIIVADHTPIARQLAGRLGSRRDATPIALVDCFDPAKGRALTDFLYDRRKLAVAFSEASPEDPWNAINIFEGFTRGLQLVPLVYVDFACHHFSRNTPLRIDLPNQHFRQMFLNGKANWSYGRCLRFNWVSAGPKPRFHDLRKGLLMSHLEFDNVSGKPEEQAGIETFRNSLDPLLHESRSWLNFATQVLDAKPRYFHGLLLYIEEEVLRSPGFFAAHISPPDPLSSEPDTLHGAT